VLADLDRAARLARDARQFDQPLQEDILLCPRQAQAVAESLFRLGGFLFFIIEETR
jgi:hypothetical protein